VRRLIAALKKGRRGKAENRKQKFISTFHISAFNFSACQRFSASSLFP
jgi:hypothetical protein